MMEFVQNMPHTRIAMKGIVLHLQDGHVFHGTKYVGPKPEGFGSMTPHELLAAAGTHKVKTPKKVEEILKEEPKGFFVKKAKRKSTRRVVGKV